MTRHLALDGDAHLAYAEDGPESAPALLLIPPLGGGLTLWRDFRRCLAGPVRVVCYDHRGVGGSSSPSLTVTTAELASDAAALVAHLGIERVAVYGESLGGMVATELAASGRVEIDRLILGSTLERASLSDAGAIKRAMSMLPCALEPGTELQPCLARRILSVEFRQQYRREVERLEALAGAAPSRRRDILALLGAAARHDARDRLASIDAQALVLAGERDELVPPAVQRDLARALPHGRFELIPQAGHALSLERPHEVADRVLAFCGGGR